MYITAYTAKGGTPMPRSSGSYSTSDLSRKSGDIIAEALRHPVTITQRNKPRLVLLNIEDYRRLMKQSDRRSAGTIETMSDELFVEFENAVAAYASEDEAGRLMNYELIQTASVIRYPYLWAREAGRGETEGRKERPVVVGVRMPRRDGDLVLFFPVTTKQPEASRFAVEVPAIEKGRAGLDADRRLWIIFDEFNTDIVGNSFYLEPEPQPAASARPSSCRCCANSSVAASRPRRSADSADLWLVIASLPLGLLQLSQIVSAAPRVESFDLVLPVGADPAGYAWAIPSAIVGGIDKGASKDEVQDQPSLTAPV
jgi:prevent-host-death family protein